MVSNTILDIRDNLEKESFLTIEEKALLIEIEKIMVLEHIKKELGNIYGAIPNI